jgi:hypothetical protein
MAMTTDIWAHRVVKDGRVKICGEYYLPRNPKAARRLEGMRLAFGRYPRGRGHEPFVSLWGNMAMWGSNLDGEEGGQLWREWCALTGERLEGDAFGHGSGSYAMDQEDDGWVAYRSLGLDWWDAESRPPTGD